ncbi:LCP family protein [Bacillus suaedaesalsae]|uniref:LCP family protein n=1 Tax=Bacillus suaedaesalsae TaxID=2810349 RepID=A0ABS2DLX7_9BACI|nr:LCP family protein [Bacillus suaedaesalsae]MBM6619065.1 LCP family protein [Bacillus suaedaesalsae]
MDRTSYRIQKKQNKKSRKKLKFILIPLLLIVLVVTGYGSYLTYKLANATADAQKPLERGEKSEKRETPIDPAKDNFSVLFIGVDEREGETNSRSDALILATFNKTEKTVKMVSIPRDSRVTIPGKERKDKITHAHAIGGADLTIETVENLFDVPVDYYVKLNFDAFIEIIDALGGVTVEVPKTFSEQNSKDEKNAITLYEGVQTLNGEEALAFVRMRKKDPLGDIGRGERQKQLITAIIEKSASISSVSKYDNVIDSIGDNLNTNFSFGNLIALQTYSKALNSIDSLKLEGYDNNINRIYYYELKDESVEDISSQFKQHLNINY